MPVTQTIQFESVSLSEIGSGTITAFLFSGASLVATLASITENGTLKGRYTGTVDDIAAGDYRLVVKFNGYTVSEPDEAVSLLLAVGTYVSKRHAVLDTTSKESIADTVLSRNVSNVESTAGEHTLATAILGMLEWEISGNDLIIKRTDGTTVHYTKTLSSATGTGDIITGLN